MNICDASRILNEGGGVTMAKQTTDLYTVDMLAGRGRGRPRKPNALTPAQRAKIYRDKKNAAIVTKITTPITGITATLEEWPFPGSPEWCKRYPDLIANA